MSGPQGIEFFVHKFRISWERRGDVFGGREIGFRECTIIVLQLLSCLRFGAIGTCWGTYMVLKLG